MDPIAQIGWVNRHLQLSSVGVNVVRDVFVVADGVHENAMSEMDDNTLMEEESQGNGARVAGGESCTSPYTELSNPPSDSVGVEEEGECRGGVFVL